MATNTPAPLIVTAAVVTRADGTILLTQRPKGKRDAGLWEFPGGKLEPEESPEEGLKRELLEELGMEIEVDGIEQVIHHRYDWGPVLLLFYRCRPINRQLEHKDVADHAWVAPEQLESYPILPADGPIVERLVREGKAKKSLAAYL